MLSGGSRLFSNHMNLCPLLSTTRSKIENPKLRKLEAPIRMGMPTHEDAKLLLELFKLRHDPAMQDAERWFLTEFRPGPWSEIEARYPSGSPGRMYLTRVMNYWEMIGALVYHNLINEDLLFDVLESTDRFLGLI